MDFFKSVFSVDPDPSSDPPHGSPDAEEETPEEEPTEKGEEETGGETPPSPNPNPSSSLNSPGGGGWSFGGLIKTFASKSESVIQTYRRDLEEFGSGIKKETAAIREVATRAVRELPVSLEVGASVAQESLESVGQVIDDFGGSVWRGTAEIISQGKDAILSMESDVAGSDDQSAPSDAFGQNISSGSSKRYNRFEVQVLAIQSDPNTFSVEPEDAEEFEMWKSGFQLAEKEEEIEGLCAENGALESNLEKLVPKVVDYETFWTRYFYKVHKLKLAEDARANLVKRVISREEEEELSWEVDDDEEQEERNEGERKGEKEEKREEEEENESEKEEKKIEASEATETSEHIAEPVEKSQVESVTEVVPAVSDDNVVSEGRVSVSKSSDDESTAKSGDKVLQEVRVETGESSKDSDVSVVSSQPSLQEEDDLGWDEIEDLGDHDEKKVSSSGGSPSKVDLRKRLSAAEDDDDLSWDIEDDEPIKP